MPSHWTYCDVAADADLYQGDVIAPTPELSKLFAEIHPHFNKEQYLAFLVVSQTCDLVRRKQDQCKAPHIALAAVREISSVLHKFIRATAGSNLLGVFLEESRGDAERLVERVINQNEQSLGLFYLHPDLDVGISTPSVAMLRVTISLRAEHYSILTAGRKGRICSPFDSKLGWLLGNLYARVGTPDWRDQVNGEQKQKQIIRSLLDDALKVAWADSEVIEAATRGRYDPTGKTVDEIKGDLNAYAPPAPKDHLFAEIARVIADVLPWGLEEVQTKLANRIRNDSKISQVLKRFGRSTK